MPASPGKADAPDRTPRDVRVDTVGFVAELQKRLGDDAKSAVKVRMLGGGLERVGGDCYEGLLVTSASATIDPEKFLRLYEKKQITRAEFLAAISVGRGPAGGFLSPALLAKISNPAPSTTSLRVSRLKGVEVSLVDAARRLWDLVGA